MGAGYWDNWIRVIEGRGRGACMQRWGGGGGGGGRQGLGNTGSGNVSQGLQAEVG